MPHCANTSDYLLAEAAPDDVALVEAGQWYTYRELRTAAGRLAAELAALDLPAGSRVGLLGPNSFFWVAAYLAVMKLNHVAVPFSDKLTATMSAAMRASSGAPPSSRIGVCRVRSPQPSA